VIDVYSCIRSYDNVVKGVSTVVRGRRFSAGRYNARSPTLSKSSMKCAMLWQGTGSAGGAGVTQ